MIKTLSRAQFLRGNFSGKVEHIRPPWTIDENHLRAQCQTCTDCMQACPEQILIRDEQGLPKVDFRKGECTFCGDCARACPATLFSDTSETPWQIRAFINDQCLPLQGVVCGTCAEECEMTAIKMKLVAGGISIPQLELESCTGCGACFRVCPTRAIEFTTGANQ